MKNHARLWAITVVVLLCALPVAAQGYPGTMPPTHQGGAGHRGQEPCWKQAGISQEAMQQHKAIEQRSRQEIQSVCSDTSLTPQQRHEKIRTIQEQTRAESERFVTAQQMQSLKSCRAQHGEGGHMGGGHMGGMGQGGNPCGEMASGNGGRMPPVTSSPQPQR